VNDRLVGGGDGATPVHPDDLVGLRQRWIRTQGQLDEVERDNLLDGTRWAWSRVRGVEQVTDVSFVRELHRRCFGNVWSWAGTNRTRVTTIGIAPYLVGPALQDLLDDARAWAEGEVSAEDIARFHHRFVAVHPFPNGNGRTGRLVTDLYAIAVGHARPTWGASSARGRADYLDALRAADDGDLTALCAFMWA
jgi:Fic-DOC domain mobile mystery protein B